MECQKEKIDWMKLTMIFTFDSMFEISSFVLDMISTKVGTIAADEVEEGEEDWSKSDTESPNI